MQTFRVTDARVTCEAVRRLGVVEANYTGLMTPQAFSDLRGMALRHSQDATAFVVRLDKALILMGDSPQVDSDSYKDAAPGALIVRHDPDEYARWTAYARDCARIGVVRTVWTDRYAELAYRWALLRGGELPLRGLH